MCTTLADGGQRCAAHTRPAYQTAPFGTPEWDSAAAAYASTPTGRMELAASLAAAEAAEDVRSAVAFEHALVEGLRLREKAALFRDELATRAAGPTATPVVPEPDGPAEGYLDSEDGFDDFDSRSEDHTFVSGGFEYTDEDAWDDDPVRDWAPSMQGQHWNHADPAFRGCRESMTSNEFIDQVCDNKGVTRAEFEAAAADYLAKHEVAFALPNGGLDRLVGPAAGGQLDRDHLRFLAIGSAAPRFTPEEIKTIAEMARSQRDAAEAPSVTTEEATGSGDAPAATPAPARRPARAALPDDPTELTRLAGSNDAQVRADVAAHHATPSEVLVVLAKEDAKAEVRAAAARNENLPQPTLLLLVSDRSIKVRAGAARNPNLPVAHLTAMAEDPNDGVKGAVARNPSTPADLYERLSGHESMTVRKHAARRQNIPAHVAARLSTDAEQQVRSTLARNKATPADVLRTLCTDEAQSVRAAVARNGNLPAALLRGRLSRDDAPGVRAAVARNENTSVAVLTRLSSDADPWVRRNVAWNPASPAVLLYCLANDADQQVRTAAQQRNTRDESVA